MKPLIVAATEAEIYPSLDFLSDHQIPYLITGVGMTATAYQLGKRIALSRPDYIVNIGIAGSFSKDIPLGSVVQVPEDYLAELGVQDDEQFIPIDSLGFGNSFFQAPPLCHLNIELPAYTGITVNTVHGNEKAIRAVKEIFPAANIETMEGAAVLFVCAEENIPCIPVRAISNYVEKRDKSTWNIPLAVENLNNWLRYFLDQNA